MEMICELIRSSNANEVSKAVIEFGAHAAHGDDVLRAFERAMLVPMLDDPLSHHAANAGQAHQVFKLSCVEIDALLISRLCLGINDQR